MKSAVVVSIIVILASTTLFSAQASQSCDFPDIQHLGKGDHIAPEGGALYLKKFSKPVLTFPMAQKAKPWDAITVYSTTHPIEVEGFYNQKETFPVSGTTTCVVLIDQDSDETGTDVVEMNGTIIEPQGLVRNLVIDTPDGTLTVRTWGTNEHSHQGTVGVIIIPQEAVQTATPTNTSLPTSTPTATHTSTPNPTATQTPSPTTTFTMTPVPTNTPAPTATHTSTPVSTNTPTPTNTGVPPQKTVEPTPTSTSTPEQDTIDYHPTDLEFKNEPFVLLMPVVSK